MKKQELELEIWKDIPGYERYYQISNYGRVKSLDRKIIYNNNKIHFFKGRIVIQDLSYKNKNGRYRVTLYKNGNHKRYKTHHLVAVVFIGQKPKGLIICHNNGNGRDNYYKNLRYDTYKNNEADKFVHKTRGYGEQSTIYKLTWKKVNKIRKMYKTKKYSMSKLGKFFGVYPGTICNIIHFKTWKNNLN